MEPRAPDSFPSRSAAEGSGSGGVAPREALKLQVRLVRKPYEQKWKQKWTWSAGPLPSRSAERAEGSSSGGVVGETPENQEESMVGEPDGQMCRKPEEQTEGGKWCGVG